MKKNRLIKSRYDGTSEGVWKIDMRENHPLCIHTFNKYDSKSPFHLTLPI